MSPNALQIQHGRRWLDIRNQYLPLRSPNALKNQSLAAAGKKNQNAMGIAPNYHSGSINTPKTPNSRTASKKSRKIHCETDAYIKKEPDDDVMSSFYGEADFRSTMSPATDYGFVEKAASTPDPVTSPYIGFLKQEEISLTEYDVPCYGTSFELQYETNATQLSHVDAGISSNAAEDMWMAYPTSPSSTAPSSIAPSDGDIGGPPSRDQWGYSAPGIPPQEQNALTAYGYNGYH
ncbi:hypothetical protein MGYG_08731 [Nannizzia gypsea CBS 118893]|uniref:Uncharacterized protein n=1 Tax=Arthroderma gypseum (strain ATCC MYA-4604 / CBS 118893) TaxID=535722 RepID=E4V6U1_ARTGP|nr:hypothetical protein MGYG_08731 [Nannizzia gypsea CBS 118893]EFQ96807.1 hypothetical protein MGYG_08731 [Nannizzia gypsea CBS 118893]